MPQLMHKKARIRKSNIVFLWRHTREGVPGRRKRKSAPTKNCGLRATRGNSGDAPGGTALRRPSINQEVGRQLIELAAIPQLAAGKQDRKDIVIIAHKPGVFQHFTVDWYGSLHGLIRDYASALATPVKKGVWNLPSGVQSRKTPLSPQIVLPQAG